MRLVNAGAKILGRQEGSSQAKGTFRVLSDGVDAILPFVNPEHIYNGGMNELQVLLEQYNPLLSAFSEEFSETISKTGSLCSGTLLCYLLIGLAAVGNQLVRFSSNDEAIHM